MPRVLDRYAKNDRNVEFSSIRVLQNCRRSHEARHYPAHRPMFGGRSGRTALRRPMRPAADAPHGAPQPARSAAAPEAKPSLPCESRSERAKRAPSNGRKGPAPARPAPRGEPRESAGIKKGGDPKVPAQARRLFGKRPATPRRAWSCSSGPASTPRRRWSPSRPRRRAGHPWPG